MDTSQPFVDLEELQRLYEETTHGEWQVATGGYFIGAYVHEMWAGIAEGRNPENDYCVSRSEQELKANISFIVAIHNAWPAIQQQAQLVEIDRLTTALHRAMWALHQADPEAAATLEKQLIEETGKGRIRPWRI